MTAVNYRIKSVGNACDDPRMQSCICSLCEMKYDSIAEAADCISMLLPDAFSLRECENGMSFALESLDIQKMKENIIRTREFSFGDCRLVMEECDGHNFKAD